MGGGGVSPAVSFAKRVEIYARAFKTYFMDNLMKLI
jgi:hypothetical protein